MLEKIKLYSRKREHCQVHKITNTTIHYYVEQNFVLNAN